MVAFGGVDEASMAGRRSSGHLRGQADADATMMERAMKLAERRNSFPAAGNMQGRTLDTHMGGPSAGAAAGAYGVWLYTVASYHEGRILHGWMEARQANPSCLIASY